MLKYIVFTAALAFAMTGLAQAQQQAAQKLAKADRQFVEGAASGNMLEVKLGELASTKAQNEEVRNFGKRMVLDHSKGNQQLMQLAQQKGIKVPAEMDKKDQKTVDRLNKLSGAEFDRAYMNEMVKDHEKDIKEYRRQADRSQDPELKAFASSTLPILEEHHKLAREIAPKVGAK